MAIRQSGAAGVNITYKILFNDAVAMTGGQPVTGRSACTRSRGQVEAEGVEAHRVVSDEPRQVPDEEPASRTASPSTIATNSIRCSASCARSRASPVLVYDQTCATEKRRRRKRGTMVDPAKRAFINDCRLRRLRRLLGGATACR
jgi:indolepyruvate ferredoxin oxidoreductase